MYCKNCGAEIASAASVCTQCGFEKGKGNNYCQVCGKPVNPGAAVCLACGAPITLIQTSEQKSKLAAGLIAIFLGGWGIHNFYLGYTKKAVLQLILGILGIFLIVPLVVTEVWGIVDGIKILTGKITTDANGTPLKG